MSLLSGVCVSPYSVKDSFSFAREIGNFSNNNYVMVSFDINSPFTSIPVDETISIICDRVFPLSNSTFLGFDKKLFTNILDFCTKNNLFLFNKSSYFQKDGAPMGGCCSPTLANIFLGYHDQIWLDTVYYI